MMQSDSQAQVVSGVSVENIIGNSDVMNFDMMAEIEKELLDNPYDMVSLVFLLYDVPDTALQRLIVFQRVSNDPATSTNLNMLHEWFRHAKHNPNWKHEFLEALLICQLHNIVRKLGFNVSSARQYYQTDYTTVKMFVNPMKKALYKLCENINSDNLLKLKKALLTYDIDTTEYDSCELVLLKLMCEKFITINQYQYNKKVLGFKVDVNKLVKIVENLPGLKKLVLEIEMLQHSMNDEPKQAVTITATTPSQHMKVDESRQGHANEILLLEDFGSTFKLLEELEDVNFKSDRENSNKECYVIKNPQKVGTCVIINQENFYPSKYSIELTDQSTSLDQRVGSDKDLMLLEKTMRSLNFTVISRSDLGHKEMIKFIMDVVKKEVSEDDSVFMLCILSHGVRGQVYAADSVKVKMDDIEKMLDSDDAVKIHHIPKVLIVQACQVEDAPALVADGPTDNHPKKSDFLIYYATAPDLEAYRNVKCGSVFIQYLCEFISKYANKEHLLEIFIRVNRKVTEICQRLGYKQVPKFEVTLLQNLYLKSHQ